jgi:hypothetical protein
MIATFENLRLSLNFGRQLSKFRISKNSEKWSKILVPFSLWLKNSFVDKLLPIGHRVNDKVSEV